MTDSTANAVRDGLIAGLAHALSNRISTISVVAQTLELGDSDHAALSDMLGQEVVRLEEILRLMRLIPTDGRPEPVLISELMNDAAALARHQRDLRDVKVDFSGGDDLLPMYGDRAAMLMAVLEAIVEEARETKRFAVRWSGTQSAVTVAIGARELAFATLPEVRRREREGSARG
ncbi:MAG: hypothetical protein M3081_03400 [Gemmatimonadota bacterium]|nr:hypothetical protein [Gemmatimonadota bacterium]